MLKRQLTRAYAVAAEWTWIRVAAGLARCAVHIVVTGCKHRIDAI